MFIATCRGLRCLSGRALFGVRNIGPSPRAVHRGPESRIACQSEQSLDLLSQIRELST